ncbi:MAG: sorbosone dehydrogenase family protein [Hyphomonadaceae bacterium]
MSRHASRIVLTLLTGLALVACGGPKGDPTGRAGWGAQPDLPEPRQTLIPTVRTADPVGWAASQAPVAPRGFTVARYADGLDHPRWLHLLPNGDVLVAEASSEPQRGGGFMGFARNLVQRRAGALGVSANRITLLRDADGDGEVESLAVFAENLNQPFGMALIGPHLYIANTDAILRFPYRTGQTRLEGAGEVFLRLPHNEGDNGHWTRDLLASPDGRKLYVSIGSVSNIPESEAAFALEEGRAAIWEIDVATRAHRVFASGLRNPNGLAWEPQTGALWVAVNERDMLGPDLAPDYMTSVQDGGFYGWPYSYFGAHVDARVRPQDAAKVESAITPDFALGAHTASLGLAFYAGEAFPARYRGGVFVGQHGSWNRDPPAGYKVVFIPFADGRPAGSAEDFLTGFLSANGNQAHGRPVGVAFDRAGALLVADDVGNVVWRVAPARVTPP